MADTTVAVSAQSLLHERGVRLGPVWVNVNTAYVFYISAGTNLVYQKTSDGGATWATAVTVKSGGITKVSVWYDKWTPGSAGTLIHIAYNDATADDTFYRNLDTLDDSLSTEVTIFAGASYNPSNWNVGTIDIVRARGGNLYIGFWGDGDGELGFYRSTDDGVTWTSRAQLADGNAADGILLMPGAETDEDDIWCIYWDRSLEELSLKVYDNSGDSWSEFSIASSIAGSSGYYQMSAVPRHRDNHVLLAIWNALDTAGSDLKVWDIGSSSDFTAKTDVVTNLNESGQVALLIDQIHDYLYAAYLKGGTWEASVDVVYKKSADGGTTWGDEQSYSEASADDLRALWAGVSIGADGGRFQPVFFNDDLNRMFANLVNDIPIELALPLRDAYVGATVDAVPSEGSARS